MAITLNGTTGITTPALDNQGNLTVDGGTIKLDGNYPVGTNNVALGDAALDSNVSGASNTAIGADALTANTASNNTAVGYQAGYNTTTGGSNTSLGYQSLFTNTTGVINTALGYSSLYSNTTGNFNIAVGQDALKSNTTASNNTAVGYQAGLNNTTGAANTAVGQQALKGNAVGELNTAVGVDSLLVATGSRNTVVGVSAGSQITTGAKNTIIGTYSGNQGGLDIRTSSNNIVLSDGDGNPRVWNTGSYLACPTVYSFPVAGRDVYVDSNGTVGYLSSIRQSKTNIVDFTDASWLLNLSPKTFNYRTKDADNNYTDQAEGELYYGLIADEVEAVNSDLCFYNEVDGQQELAGVSYSKMITPMLKLIQEQQATITALTARITALEGN
jgi:hypothetical protein